jgi:hypothetical protein
MPTDLLLVAMIGFAGQVVAALVLAGCAWIAARKLATELAINTRLTQDIRHTVSELERPYARPASGSWAAPGSN